jgi:very-short-patch-repair endonuclease
MGGRRKTEADYRELAARRGFIWAACELPYSTDIPTPWTCPQGHTWNARYDDINRGRGCSECAKVSRSEKQRLSDEKYYELAQLRNYKIIGEIPPNTATKTEWQCGICGNIWAADYNHINRGHGCHKCGIKKANAKKRLTADDFHAIAAERGMKWMGQEVVDARTKTLWLCPNNHEWESSHNNLRKGFGCPHCSGKAQRKPEHYVELTRQSGKDIEWIGPEVSNTGAKTGWHCLVCDYKWQTSYDTIKSGAGCPRCAKRETKTIEDYRELERITGYTWKSEQLPENVTTKTIWGCPYGHEWPASYSVIKAGNGCPHCAGNARHQPEDYIELGRIKGFVFEGPEVTNVSTQTYWICQNGHRFPANYNNIQQGHGCPQCIDIINGAKVSRVQKELCQAISGELNYPVLTFNIDVALVGEKIAIEYDAYYWHSGREEYDAERDKILMGHGWRILRIKSNALLPTQRQINRALNKLRNGETFATITLKDWGKGPTFSGRASQENNNIKQLMLW